MKLFIFILLWILVPFIFSLCLIFVSYHYRLGYVQKIVLENSADHVLLRVLKINKWYCHETTINDKHDILIILNQSIFYVKFKQFL